MTLSYFYELTKKILLSAVLTGFSVSQLIATEATFYITAEDEKLIRQIVGNWLAGWESCDSELATEGFADDADWMNAFGIKKKGKTQIKQFLDWAFSLPNAKERKNSGEISSIRFIRSDVALVYEDFHVEKQRYLTGEEMVDRHGHMIRVMVKENGQWQIASMLIMDEKSKQ